MSLSNGTALLGPKGGDRASLDLDLESQALQLADQHVERFGDVRLGQVLALDDGLVDLCSALHVVRLHRQDLLQPVTCAVALQGPHFHLSEALAAELGLPAQGLLRNERIWTC